ncbi:MAG: hypothetical protein O9972_25060 [Burkholderiales bacterium]|nr:hypothetical protein [Burkholderiales bacterium]
MGGSRVDGVVDRSPCGPGRDTRPVDAAPVRPASFVAIADRS